MTSTEITAFGAGSVSTLVALDRPQLEAAHAKLISWCDARLASLESERAENDAALAVSEKNKWATKPFRTVASRLARRVVFFEKVKAALLAGFVVVPNFDMDVFAIRSKAIKPRGNVTENCWDRFIQTAQILPEGVGRYLDPNPVIQTDAVTVTDGKGGTKAVTRYFPVDVDEEIPFPFDLAEPALMTRVGEAMALKLFDEIGVARHTSRRSSNRGDPILLGTIRNPSARPDVTFFLGWHFDPDEL